MPRSVPCVWCLALTVHLLSHSWLNQTRIMLVKTCLFHFLFSVCILNNINQALGHDPNLAQCVTKCLEGPELKKEPSETTPKDGFKIICYYTYYSWYRVGTGTFFPESIDPNLCTHVVYNAAMLNPETLVLDHKDSWADIDNSFYKRVTDLKSKGVKVLLSVGGWAESGTDKYSKLINNQMARIKFITSTVSYLLKHNFDGLEVAWSYPKCWQADCSKGPDSDVKAFGVFIRELKLAFRPRKLILAAQVARSPYIINQAFDIPTLQTYLDWFAVESINYHSAYDKRTAYVHPLYGGTETDSNANFSMHFWLSKEVPRDKLVMGLCSYARTYTLSSPSEHGLGSEVSKPGVAGRYSKESGILSYYEVCDNIRSKNWTLVQDESKTMGSYAYGGDQWASFDEPELMGIKAKYAKDLKLAGVSFWTLDYDDFNNKCGGGKYPLLRAVNDAVRD